MAVLSAKSSGSVRAPKDMEALWHQAEGLVRNLPEMRARASELSPSSSRGTHGRRKPGTGDSFWQFRPFHQGDTVRDIDWRRSGRSDSLFVRQNEWETAQNVWLWCDTSPSMAFQSTLAQQSKADRATVLALALAMLLVAGGERVGHLAGQERPAGGRFGARRLFDSMLHHGKPTELAFPRYRAIGQHAHLIAIGDFLADEAAIEKAVMRYAHAGVKGHLIQVLDPAEEDFPFEGRITLHGLEGEGDHRLSRAEEIRAAFEGRLGRWREQLDRIARGVEWSFTVHRTDRPAQMTLLALAAQMGVGL